MFTTPSTSGPLRVLTLLLVFAVAALPARAQSDDDEEPSLPTVDFAVKVMQSAQFLRTEDTDPALPSDEAEPGFQRLRYNFEVSAQFHERLSAFVDIAHEPNDFGTGGNSFAPAVDYVAIDVMLTDELTFRLGTPVTGLFNFRGYSDGAATQGNPLIGNSPIDFVTAETGVSLVGDFDAFGFDLTTTSPTFFETFAPGTGVSVIGKVRAMPTDVFSVGAGVGVGTNSDHVDQGTFGVDGSIVNWITGDGENYNFAGVGQPQRVTHAYLLPGVAPILAQIDARADFDLAVVDVWGGYGTEDYSFAGSRNDPTTPRLSASGELVEETSTMFWAGLTAKVNVTDVFFVAGRGSYADNISDWASDLDETNLWRVQGGVGATFFDHGMVKVEGVYQSEGINSPGQIGKNWFGAQVEFSVGF